MQELISLILFTMAMISSSAIHSSNVVTLSLELRISQSNATVRLNRSEAISLWTKSLDEKHVSTQLDSLLQNLTRLDLDLSRAGVELLAKRNLSELLNIRFKPTPRSKLIEVEEDYLDLSSATTASTAPQTEQLDYYEDWTGGAVVKTLPATSSTKTTELNLLIKEEEFDYEESVDDKLFDSTKMNALNSTSTMLTFESDLNDNDNEIDDYSEASTTTTTTRLR